LEAFMHRRLLPLATLLVFAACGGYPAAPLDDGTATLNAAVSRDVFLARPGRITWLNTQRDLGEPPDVLLLGYDPADHPACHVGDPTPRGIRVQEVFHVTHEGTDYPGEHDLVTTLGVAPLYLYDLAAFAASGTDPATRCDFAMNGWFARGSWTAVFGEDNDISGIDGTPGTNSWGGNESGQLAGADGSRYLYEWKYRARCGPDIPGFCTWMHDVDHVRQLR